MATRRGSSLHKSNIHKGSRWAHDIDYVHKLNKEEKAWLGRFLNEQLNGLFDREPEKDLRDDQDYRRQLWREGNARRRDIMSVPDAVENRVPHSFYEVNGINTTEEVINKVMEKPLRDQLASLAFQVVLNDHGFSLRMFPIK